MGFTGAIDLNTVDVLHLVVALLPVWIFGALIGLLLPRPKWLEGCSRSTALFMTTPPGTIFRQLAILFHGAFIVRDVWYYFTSPGTFRAFVKATCSWLSGQGFQLPQTVSSSIVDAQGTAVPGQHVHPEINWYVTETDLNYFKNSVEAEVEVVGYGRWEKMMEKKFEGSTYIAWRRTLPSGKTEYKSTTIVENATAQEMMDFYLDDPTRMKWDGMISHSEILESEGENQRLQVVLWRRSFPFSFVSDREYVIGRRCFKEGPNLYGITKAVDHPAAVRSGNVVRMETYHSMWRSRTIPCPNGSSKPACETILLHHEDFKIPENLARFAVRHGMAGFVKKMFPAAKDFVAERRTRVNMFESDARAYGMADKITRMARVASSPAAFGFPSSASSSSLCSISSAGSCESDSRLYVRRRSREQVGPLRRLGTVMLAAGVAVVIGRSASTRSTTKSYRRVPY